MNSIFQLDEPDDDMPKDKISIEVLSDDRNSEWSIYSADRSSIAGSDVSSVDFQKVSLHSKMATIVHHDGRQFIERRDLDDGGLPYSGEFYLGDELWKLNGEDCLLMSHRRYIAKVSMDGTVDLDGAVDFEEAVRMLLKHLKVVKVLLDEQLEECNKAKSVLEMILDKPAGESGKYIDHKRDVMLVRILLQKHGNSLNMNFKHDLINISRLSMETMSALDNYVTMTLKLLQRNAFLNHINDPSLSDEFINVAIHKALTIHRARLAVICPSNLLDKLKELPDDHILYVSTDDMNMFSDMTTLNHALFEAAVPMIFSKFLTRIRDINDEQLADFEPLSNRIFLYMCKSLQEVAEQLGAHTKADNAIIYSEALGWEVTNLQEESHNSYNECLRQQLHILAALANHFEPGGPFRTSRFPYEFKLFQNMDAIPEPVRVWMCLLDDCMKDLVQADVDKLQMLSCFFKSYVSFIASEDFQSETLECLRRITHDSLRSLADMKSSQHDRTTVASVLLEYNDMISSCLDKFLCEHFGNDCDQIQATLQRIVGQAMNKNVTSQESTEFSILFKQLLKDLSDLPLEWYLQLVPSESRNSLLRGQFVVPVDNRWKDTEHECLKVVDPEGFVKMYKLLHNGEEIPKHYQLKAIQVLLDKIAAEQSCYEGKLPSDKHQLRAMINMIDSIRNPLLYLNRQSDYSCFEEFLQKIGESFSHAIEERRLEDYRIPMSPTNDSAAIDPPHGETPKEPLIDLFEGSTSKGLLTNGFEKYSAQFDKLITETVQLPRENRIEQIVSDVMLKIRPQLATSWTAKFKHELPEVLAGLSAVWSLIVSKNGSSSEKLVKPSTLQISCILSLFGDRNPNHDDLYRLLYISTQQGKECVLGLTAALLALYGHKVLIACYNSNLARRKSIHLIEVFKSFSIHSDISFGSVDDMARDRSKKVYDKFAAYIHECLGMEMNGNNRPKYAPDDKRSVLLIDDIDILLRRSTLGQVFERFVMPTIPGLGLIQEERISLGRYEEDQIYRSIMRSRDPEIVKLQAWLARPQTYTVYEDKQFHGTQHTNQSLLNDHFRYFRYKQSNDNNLRISSGGVMMVKNKFDVKNQQARCFNYFKLKKSDFQQTVNGYKNYGYLTMGCIPFPYEHLLKSFPLVFGFASAPLDGYEEITLRDHYKIHHKIAKRNPLDTISTQFDSKKGFLCVDSNYEWDWMISIMVAINAAIDRNCSVLVFFKSALEMQTFQSKFALHLKHLSVTAIKTASNGENLSADEIAVDEVTVLAIETDPPIAEDREVHVIQTFWSCDSKEEDLIRRQAERSHGCGSYELIVLRKHLSIAEENEKDTLSYDLLVTLRAHRPFGLANNSLTCHMEKYELIEQLIESF
ncbi:uncharacterized protein LOC135713689 [Ochlerotatus camptorhynchus]|uniref:uncharacterized protein LOC135713689 n=1 Tax=Ochlerotatus camptorhynchus TaxID=644619 RepID=UPI0031DB200E